MENIKVYGAIVKLDLADGERQRISDLADMLLNSFSAFSGIDTGDTEPMYTVLDVRNVLREDVSAKMLTRDKLLTNAPAQYDGFFQVPKTI